MNSEWKIIRLDAIAVLNPGRRVAKGVEAPFIDMAALPQHARDIQFVNIERRTAKGSGAHFHNGDTLLARITPCLENGKTAQVRCLNHNEVGEGSTEFIVLSGIDSADNDFVYYLCRDTSFREYAIGRMEGTSGRQRVSWQSISAYEFLCPPKNVRRAAAELLSTLDDRITLLRETNATLEAIAQALFKSWFVDFDSVRAKMEGRASEGMDKATAALFPDGLEESELGLVPRGWSTCTFRDTIHVFGGGTPKTAVAEYWGGDIPWFSVVDAPGPTDVFVVDTEKHITEAGLNESSAKLLPAGTTIISARGTVGRLAVIAQTMAMNQSCYGLRGKAGDTYFTYFSTTRLVSQLKQRVHGSVFDTITQETFSGVLLSYPPIVIIKAFENEISAMLERIHENVIQVQTLAIIRDTLLPKLLSGELSVDVIHHEEGT
ncbi:restriction endonuclease subunit S [Verminephrobacter aporrectodeae subsp. tuberculatae]|uniref:restriction endonuclease subunit S n=1 Tax=Verminephrobacter aporrectodeae TaxID=1110389 RepID=UPI0022436797|nr:restriction endonuclease subunit S [Verminephrobacter aporrectodeae]MCW8163508.1 restriction endonuclease subunit S [Verminephrobacter aporrectodeae subsp. tuberculatae]MCW8167771.1 restriction endonuclease subunit S [Verminephrobacter aporrectodeae subsp. tuberculatae]